MPQAKLIAMMRRKEGVSHEAFREYYESTHAPLAVAHFGRYFSDYRRNFPIKEYVVDNDHGVLLKLPSERPVDTDHLSYDVITEFWYHDELAMDDMHRAMQQVNDVFISDEAEFIDRDTLRIFVVDESRSILPDRDRPAVPPA